MVQVLLLIFVFQQAADPEHGKHLETVNAVLLGISVDFVSMRGDGAPSPLTDAYHRDLTINAMFYNINTKQVEDPTGFGVSDLQQGLLRAANPDPNYTLRYDPLRAVRAMRFKASTRYSVDPSLMNALSQPALCEQLLVATKRDRIGQELKKAFSNPQYDLAGAVLLLAETGLFGPVLLGAGQASTMPLRDMSFGAARRMATLQQLLRADGAPVVPSLIGLVLAACFWELNPGRPGERVKESEVYAAVVGALRLSHQDAEATVIVMRGAVRFRQLAVEAQSRLQLGLCLRMCGVLWPSAWVLSVAADETLDRVELFKAIKNCVFDLQLDGVWTMKPLLNGNEISKVLNISPGPVFAVLTEKLIEEQLRRPSLTYEEAQAFLVKFHQSM